MTSPEKAVAPWYKDKATYEAALQRRAGLGVLWGNLSRVADAVLARDGVPINGADGKPADPKNPRWAVVSVYAWSVYVLKGLRTGQSALRSDVAALRKEVAAIAAKLEVPLPAAAGEPDTADHDDVDAGFNKADMELKKRHGDLFRDADTGRFITEDEAEANPETSEHETY